MKHCDVSQYPMAAFRSFILFVRGGGCPLDLDLNRTTWVCQSWGVSVVSKEEATEWFWAVGGLVDKASYGLLLSYSVVLSLWDAPGLCVCVV